MCLLFINFCYDITWMANEKLVKWKRFVDEETGQVFEAIVLGQPYWHTDKGFIKVFAVGLKELVENEELIAKAGRLLLWILAEKLDWNSYEFYMTANEVVKALNISPRTYYSWLSTLLKAGILERVGANIYRLKPRLAIRGHTKKAEITIEGEKFEGVDF